MGPFDNDQASLSWLPASAPSRRAILATGALGIAGAALAAAPASASAAIAAVPERAAKSAKRAGFRGREPIRIRNDALWPTAYGADRRPLVYGRYSLSEHHRLRACALA